MPDTYASAYRRIRVNARPHLKSRLPFRITMARKMDTGKASASIKPGVVTGIYRLGNDLSFSVKPNAFIILWYRQLRLVEQQSVDVGV